ncbi:uncharacterized protein LOC129949439 isoform X2 [Eupeodes corollae]|uniref:uncharacterized protein LOC129949439 isoform X2 n=1 Tax=Eupeodes corollae TaxID=290404 RepID=UPI0024938D8A|nr:uncharacterized protein LOC129949439 isoform X2 [Eupeodes corollae]
MSKFETSEASVNHTFDTGNIASADMEFIKKELKYLRSAIDKQNNSISTITTLLRQLIKEEVVLNDHHEKLNLPVETETDLEGLENEVAENFGKYETFRDLVFGRGGLEKNLKHIISAEVALHYNWDGTTGKKAFKNFKSINEALFNAVKPEITSSEVYKKAIRQGLKRIKNLHFKRISLQKKQDLKVTIIDSLSL